MNFIVWLIIGAEISFWIFLFAGLVVRYAFNQKKLGLYILAALPVIDIVLLTAAAIDIRNGATAGLPHALAGVYIGCSIAFGKVMIEKGDLLYRSIFMKEEIIKKKYYGMEYAFQSMKGSLRHLLAFMIGVGCFWLVIMYAGDDRTQVLQQFTRTWTIILIIDFIISGTYFIWPKGKKVTSEQ